MVLVVLASIIISCALRHQAWSKHRPVEVALKVACPPLLVAGVWATFAFGVSIRTDPVSVALVACHTVTTRN